MRAFGAVLGGVECKSATHLHCCCKGKRRAARRGAALRFQSCFLGECKSPPPPTLLLRFWFLFGGGGINSQRIYTVVVINFSSSCLESRILKARGEPETGSSKTGSSPQPHAGQTWLPVEGEGGGGGEEPGGRKRSRTKISGGGCTTP